MAGTVDSYIEKRREWAELLTTLRRILRATELQETVKWGAPVYALDGYNVVGISAFSSYAGLWFFDGCYLDDADGVLVNAQDGKTRGLRQWRFQADDPIDEARIRAYIDEAIANARAGKRLEPAAKTPIETPDELRSALDGDESLAAAYAALTPGRQREYAEYVAEAKQEATRARRLEKVLPMIARGEGLNDRYR